MMKRGREEEGLGRGGREKGKKVVKCRNILSG